MAQGNIILKGKHSYLEDQEIFKDERMNILVGNTKELGPGGHISAMLIHDPDVRTITTGDCMETVAMHGQSQRESQCERPFLLAGERLIITDIGPDNVKPHNVVDTYHQLQGPKTLVLGRYSPLFQYEDTSDILNALERHHDQTLCVTRRTSYFLPVLSHGLFFHKKATCVIRDGTGPHYLCIEGDNIIMTDSLDIENSSFHIHCLMYIGFETLAQSPFSFYFVFCHVDQQGKVKCLSYDGKSSIKLEEKNISLDNPPPISTTSEVVFRVDNISDLPNIIICNLETNRPGYYLRSTGKTLDVYDKGGKRPEEMDELRFEIRDLYT